MPEGTREGVGKGTGGRRNGGVDVVVVVVCVCDDSSRDMGDPE